MTGLKVEVLFSGVSWSTKSSSSSLQMAVMSVVMESVRTSFLGGIRVELSCMELERVWAESQATPEPPERSMSTSSTKSNHVRPQRRLNWKSIPKLS